MNKEIKIGYGPMLPSIGNQLYHQGFEFINQDIESKVDIWRDAVNRLYIPGHMSQSEHDKIIGRIQKFILSNIKPIEYEDSGDIASVN